MDPDALAALARALGDWPQDDATADEALAAAVALARQEPGGDEAVVLRDVFMARVSRRVLWPMLALLGVTIVTLALYCMLPGPVARDPTVEWLVRLVGVVYLVGTLGSCLAGHHRAGRDLSPEATGAVLWAITPGPPRAATLRLLWASTVAALAPLAWTAWAVTLPAVRVGPSPTRLVLLGGLALAWGAWAWLVRRMWTGPWVGRPPTRRSSGAA